MENVFETLATKCLKLMKNKLYFKYRALSPAIYRMPTEFAPKSGVFGTEGSRIYADPVRVVFQYKQNPDGFMRMYLHMLMHCIYLHPFLPGLSQDKDQKTWELALDICAEAAVMRLEPQPIDGDPKREDTIKALKEEVKMFLPELVYKAITAGTYDVDELSDLFRMDDHVWLMSGAGGDQKEKDGKGKEKENQKHRSQRQGSQPQKSQDDSDQDVNGQSDQEENDQKDQNGQDGQNQKDQQDQGGQGNQNGQDDQDGQGSQKGNNRGSQQNGSQSKREEQKRKWSDVSRQIAADLESFHKQGKESGSMVQEIGYLTRDKMEYEEFLRSFAVLEERMKIDMDEFELNYYSYGLSLPEKLCFIEPLEYKEDKAVRDFVIAIDTSGSCSGELVKKFLNKTYSILKSTESFSSRVNIHIVQCDAKVQKDTKITTMEDMEIFMSNMKLYGFGGTDFRPVFEYVNDLIDRKEFMNLGGLIYFTDGYGTYPAMPAPYKTAFVFLEDYESRKNVPAWAMSVYWDEE